MGRIVKAVRPFTYKYNSNFKLAVWEEWCKSGGATTGKRPLEKYYESLSYHLNMPTIRTNKKEARLCFCEGASIRFDTFPDYLGYEIIPMMWDCWPAYFDDIAKFYTRHKVKSSIFTSAQTAQRMQECFPDMNILHCPEAIETRLYKAGKNLTGRKYDYIEYGRCSRIIDTSTFDASIRVISSHNERSGLATREMLCDALADSKVVIALTRLDNQPEIAQGIDTLTQRYWECLLSRCVIVGRAPKELVDLMGYDPVINIDMDHFNEQLLDILAHIEDYQPLVDRNRETALRMGDWKLRIRKIMEWLESIGYKVKS